MDEYGDIPLSTIKTDREWKKSIHFGFWCTCYDEIINGDTTRMVFKSSNDPGRLEILDDLYLVSPSGKRLDN